MRWMCHSLMEMHYFQTRASIAAASIPWKRNVSACMKSKTSVLTSFVLGPHHVLLCVGAATKPCAVIRHLISLSCEILLAQKQMRIKCDPGLEKSN